jgi:ABC-type lipoprotein release transport system permease subunit
MGAILKIAVRNLTQHKVKSLIVGALITLGITLTFIGNSLFETAAEGVKRGYSENFTGDVMIQAVNEKKFSLFGSEDFGFGGTSDPTPVLQKYDQVLATVRSLPQLQGFTSQVAGFAFVNLEEKGQAFNLLFGIEPENYFDTFHSVKILEGRMLKNGENGIMMSRKRLDQIAKDNKKVLKLGDEILLNAFSDKGLKIRGVPLVGIYEYVVPTQALEVVSFVDVQTLRALNAMTVGTKDEVKVDDSTKALLAMGNDDFFGDDSTVSAAKANAQVNLDGLLGDKTVRNTLQTIDNGSWHNVLVRLKAGSDIGGTIATLNATFVRDNLPVKAVGWKQAAGTTAALTDVAQIIFNIVIIILAVVAVIIIINTLVISVMERTSEIGTMRAVGAQKPFIRRLFVAETMLLAGFFGLVGIVLGSLAVLLINAIGIKIDNDFLQVLFGSANLKPNLSLNQILLSVGYTLFIGMVSWIYPVSIALKVSPLKAIATE